MVRVTGNNTRDAPPLRAAGQKEQAMTHTITILPSMRFIDAAAMAAQRGGILQTNGKASVIARTLLPGYARISCGLKKAA